MIQENVFYVGIDIASKINAACVLNGTGQMTINPFSFSNNNQGARELEDKLVEVCERESAASIKVATEATSFYDWHLADYLAESERLLPFNPEIYRFNPRIVRNFKKAMKDRDKTDNMDAIAIAQRLRFGDLPTPYSSLKTYIPLQRLTRYRFHLTGEIAGEKNYFLSHLVSKKYYHFPFLNIEFVFLSYLALCEYHHFF